MTIQQRIENLLHYLQQGIYEKETETALALLAALAGESILLLGPPGVAKSMVARKLKEAFKNTRSFEYLMSRFSTPDEIFGPVSIARLKESDKYERATDGFLPTADVVFLDEIWKAGPAIQNTLLTVMNEKLFRNGDKEMHLPLKLLVAASNELPAKGEGLEALWDRFMIRIVCSCIRNENVFRNMLCQPTEGMTASSKSAPSPITAKEYALWQKEAQQVTLSPALLDAISYIRQQLQKVEVEGSELARRIYVSDRRWVHIANLLRTSAYVQGREVADVADLLPMYHCLWNEPIEIEQVKHIVLKSIFAPYLQQLETLAQNVKADLRTCKAKEALAKAVREHDHRDDDLLIVDKLFYQIENHGTGHTYVFITDFKSLHAYNPDHIQRGVIYKDNTQRGRSIVRLYTSENKDINNQTDHEFVTLYRDNERIFINGVGFKMRHKGAAIMSPQTGHIGGLFDSLRNNAQEDTHEDTIKAALPYAHYEDDAENICNQIDAAQKHISQNMFANANDKQQVEVYLQEMYKRIALCRVDIRKLLYNE